MQGPLICGLLCQGFKVPGGDRCDSSTYCSVHAQKDSHVEQVALHFRAHDNLRNGLLEGTQFLGNLINCR